MSRHQPFGCVKCATSWADVSLYIRGGAKSGAIAGIAGCPMFVDVAGTAARPSYRSRQIRPCALTLSSWYCSIFARRYEPGPDHSRSWMMPWYMSAM
jgi:hypothetical protein